MSDGQVIIVNNMKNIIYLFIDFTTSPLYASDSKPSFVVTCFFSACHSQSRSSAEKLPIWLTLITLSMLFFTFPFLLVNL